MFASVFSVSQSFENMFSNWKEIKKRTNPQNEEALIQTIRNSADCEGFIPTFQNA